MAKSRKLPMVKRESKKQRSVSFTKRRHGLFNKAAELFMLCDAHLAVLVSSPSSKPKRQIYSFGYPSVASVLYAFLQNSIPSECDDKAKQSALSLLNEIEYLETQLYRKNSTEESISSKLEAFENSESIEELKKLVCALEELIDTTKSQFNRDTKASVLADIIQFLEDSPNSELTATETQPDYTCPASKSDCIDVLDLQDVDFLHAGFNGDESAGVGVELSCNGFALNSNTAATLDIAHQNHLYANDYEDPFFVDHLWT